MKTEIINALSRIERNETEIQHLESIKGGDINQAFKVVTAEGTYFIKINSDIPASFFRSEAEGLEKLRETQTVHVPEVYYFNQPGPGETGVLVLEWIEGKVTASTARQLGTSLGEMHLIPQKKYGYPDETFVGTLSQHNELYESWVDYYRDKRLMPQFNFAERQNKLSGGRGKNLWNLISRLEKWINPNTSPSLLHGDLWGGNWLAGPGNIPYLIDPSVFYGDRFMEIAFTELFGGFPDSFYQSYQITAPLPAYYADVKELYQLYYLLVHLNLFGEMYGRQVDQVIRKYI